MIDTKHIVSDKAVAYKGALLAIAVVFAYSLVVMLWVILYSSLLIIDVMPPEKRSFILLTSGFSIAYSVAVFSLLMAVPSSIVGAIFAVLLKKLLLYFNPIFEPGNAFLISCTIVVGLVALGYIVLLTLGVVTDGFSVAVAFWVFVPAILFCICGVVGGMRLNAYIE